MSEDSAALAEYAGAVRTEELAAAADVFLRAMIARLIDVEDK